MDTKTLKRAYRNAWILLLLISVFVIGLFYMTLRSHAETPKPTWEMGGVPFVPASSNYAEGYYDSSGDPKPAPKEETK